MAKRGAASNAWRRCVAQAHTQARTAKAAQAMIAGVGAMALRAPRASVAATRKRAVVVEAKTKRSWRLSWESGRESSTIRRLNVSGKEARGRRRRGHVTETRTARSAKEAALAIFERGENGEEERVYVGDGAKEARMTRS